MKHVTLPGGESVPALGMGTWMIGEDAATRAEEIASLQQGIDLGAGLMARLGWQSRTFDDAVD